MVALSRCAGGVIGRVTRRSATLASSLRAAPGRPLPGHGVAAGERLSRLGSSKRYSSSSQKPLVKPQEMSGGEVIYGMLHARGIETVFGYSGGAALPLIDAFQGKDIRFITSAHEQ